MSTDFLLPQFDPVKPLGRLLIQLEREGLLQDVNRICTEGNVLIEEVFSRSRRAHIARARHRLWLWLHVEKGWSYPAIGDRFDRDHTTIMSGVRAAAQDLGVPAPTGRTRRAA
ncbi:helix-turn-helix domain-containing protein [Sorangium sp. So ce388]|uniref:helix-turn-helix domain-containing protein n=1 Tax=Sorangium sp. So ce388 TaxID=3133309 RepID=UPI003F5B4CCD